jgi:hypothetical protein
MAVELKEKLALLCEGAADKAFFTKLIEKRNLPRFDIPFPTSKEFGKDAFDRMLHALRGDPAGFARIQGILIVADGGTMPARTFSNIQRQIKNAGGYSVPGQMFAPSTATPGSPSIAIMLLPDDGSPGSLESLCEKALVGRKTWINRCVEQFLSCGRIEVLNWPPEKRAKARFHSVIAATYKRDPSRALSYAFKEPPAPMINVKSSAFNGVERRIRSFCVAVGVT